MNGLNLLRQVKRETVLLCLWDMKEDIGYVDELDVAIVKAIETQS